MNNDLDPNRYVNKPAEPQNNVPVIKTEQVTHKPRKTLPSLLDSLVKEDTIGGDLCRYFVFPAIEQGLHKIVSALAGHFLLGQDIKPSNGKGRNGVYIYDDNVQRDYTVYSSGGTKATIIDSNGFSQTIYNNKYSGSNNMIYELQHYDEDNDRNHVNPLIWSGYEVEAKNEGLRIVLEEILNEAGIITVQDVYDALGLSGAPHTANKWGWKNISKVSVYLKSGDNTTMVVNMGFPAQPIDVLDKGEIKNG